MSLRTPEWLAEILRTAGFIEMTVAGRTVEDYRTDAALRSIVERKRHIIGQNPVRIRDRDLPTFVRVDRGIRIIGLRNLLAHAYSDLDDDQVWGYTGTPLTTLVDDVARLLRERAPDDPAPD